MILLKFDALPTHSAAEARLAHANGEYDINAMWALGLGLDDVPSHVMATIGAYHVRRHGRAALAAISQFLSLLEIVSATRASASIALPAFWNGHKTLLRK